MGCDIIIKNVRNIVIVNISYIVREVGSEYSTF